MTAAINITQYFVSQMYDSPSSLQEDMRTWALNCLDCLVPKTSSELLSVANSASDVVSPPMFDWVIGGRVADVELLFLDSSISSRSIQMLGLSKGSIVQIV